MTQQKGRTSYMHGGIGSFFCVKATWELVTLRPLMGIRANTVTTSNTFEKLPNRPEGEATHCSERNLGYPKSLPTNHSRIMFYVELN